MASKVAVIAGYGTGISTAAAKKLGSEGFKLALVARMQAKLDVAAAALTSAGYTAKGYSADLSDDKAVRAAVAAAQRDLGPITILLWNPYRGPAHYTNATAKELTSSFNTSVTGLVSAFQASYEDLRATKGAVLVTGGVLSLEDDGATEFTLQLQAATLAVSKAALRKLVHLMNKGLANEGIYVVEVTVMGVVKGTAFDPEGKSSLTAEAIADEFWSLYTKRDPAVWYVKL